MALAVALAIAAVVASVAVPREPERVVAAEVAATESPDEPQRYSPGEEGPATGRSSSEREPARYLSGGEESLGYDSPPSYGEPVGQREEKIGEAHPVAATS